MEVTDCYLINMIIAPAFWNFISKDGMIQKHLSLYSWWFCWNVYFCKKRPLVKKKWLLWWKRTLWNVWKCASKKKKKYCTVIFCYVEKPSFFASLLVSLTCTMKLGHMCAERCNHWLYTVVWIVFQVTLTFSYRATSEKCLHDL